MSGRGAVYGAAGLAGAAAAGWCARQVWRALLAGGEPRGRCVGADEDIALLEETVDALHALAESAGGSPSPDAIYGFSVRWGTMLAGRLVRLERYANRGDLVPGEQQRYSRLRHRLHESLPLIDRLGLVRPSVTLGETEDAETDFRRGDEE